MPKTFAHFVHTPKGLLRWAGPNTSSSAEDVFAVRRTSHVFLSAMVACHAAPNIGRDDKHVEEEKKGRGVKGRPPTAEKPCSEPSTARGIGGRPLADHVIRGKPKSACVRRSDLATFTLKWGGGASQIPFDKKETNGRTTVLHLRLRFCCQGFGSGCLNRHSTSARRVIRVDREGTFQSPPSFAM